MSSSTPSPSRFQVPKDALKALSIRTGTPLPSLIFSFAILHELSAIVPLVGIFYGARVMGVGEMVVKGVMQDGTRGLDAENAPPGPTTWARSTMRNWIEEGDRWAERVGHRYGIFGYSKRPRGSVGSNNGEHDRDSVDDQRINVKGRIAGDVANAVVAYGMTKALLPVRIAASVYFSPAFSRGLVEPLRRLAMRPFKRGGP